MIWFLGELSIREANGKSKIPSFGSRNTTEPIGRLHDGFRLQGGSLIARWSLRVGLAIVIKSLIAKLGIPWVVGPLGSDEFHQEIKLSKAWYIWNDLIYWAKCLKTRRELSCKGKFGKRSIYIRFKLYYLTLIIISLMSNFVYKQPKIDHQKSPHRRSQRKVKRINKDEFLQIYQKHKKDKTTPSQNYFHHTTLNHLEQKCMHMIQSHTHQSTFLMLQEMNNAFEEQKQKLQNYFKIKLNQIPSNSFEAKLNFSIHKKSTDMNQSERAQECTKSLSENK